MTHVIDTIKGMSLQHPWLCSRYSCILSYKYNKQISEYLDLQQLLKLQLPL